LLDHRVCVRLISCPELLPEPWEMADDFAVAREELLAAAG
jgi:diacylglycerol O-acyltransferase / wax synthase